MRQRHLEILKLVNEEERISVKDLSEKLDISMVTIRKDLKDLEDQNLLERQHGFAVKIPMDAIDARMTMFYPEKQAIAKAAAELVHAGETVMIESGSTCALFAQELAQIPDVTIITNSAYIARHAKGKTGVILLGGDYDLVAEVTTGSVTRLCAGEYHVDKLFVGVDGYTPDAGFTNVNHTRCATVRDIAKQADHVIALTTSDKFGKRSVAKMFISEEVYMVVTDQNLSDEYEKILGERNIRVIKAEKLT